MPVFIFGSTPLCADIIICGPGVIAPRYDTLSQEGTMWKIREKGKTGIVDYRGREVVAPLYDSL